MGNAYYKLSTTKGQPETIGTASVQGTTLAVGGRTWADVKTYFRDTQTTYLGYTVPLGINSGEFRFQTKAEDDAQVVEVWGSRGTDHFTLLATLTLTGGTQTADSSLVFVDTIVASTENLPKAGVVCDNAGDGICRYSVDLCGFDKILVMATTLAAGTTLAVQLGGY